MNTKAIAINNLSFKYPDGTQALTNLNLEVAAGHKVVLLGPNGAGKSTLLHHFNGLRLPQQGKVFVLGRGVNRKSEKWVRAKVGLIFQDPDNQLFAPTVWEDVLFGPLNLGLSMEEASLLGEKALLATGMWEYRHKIPLHLSLGQKKRVAIAGVLAMEPEIIVLDEPTAYLDPEGQEELLLLLEKIHLVGKTIILATHDVDMAADWADSILVLSQGKLIAQGGIELLKREDIIQQANLRSTRITELFKVAEMPGEELPVNLAEGKICLRKIIKNGEIFYD